jgi:urease beta subunit
MSITATSFTAVTQISSYTIFAGSHFHGFEVSYVRNVHRYFGVKGDFSAPTAMKNSLRQY